MVTTVTDNSPQSINTSLFSLDREVQEVKKIAESFDEKLSGIDIETGVISVNGKQGVVELTASDVDALPNTTVIPTTTSELENTSGFITINDVGASLVPVTRKVNDKQLNTDITLTASDVGALPDTTVIPTKTSQLTNDNGFITSSGNITGNAATATTADSATKATQDASGNVITDTYATKSELTNGLTSKRVFPLYVDNDCKANNLFYFAMKNPDGWIDVSLSKMLLRSTSIHNGDIIFKHKLGNYILQMFPSGDPYRITGAIDRFSYRQNIGFDIEGDGLVRGYFADGVPTSSSGGFDDVAGLFGINFRVYAPDYED